jgi:hypothetical protein
MRVYLVRIPNPFPEYFVKVQGEHSGSNCRVAVYKLIDETDGLTHRRAEKWGRTVIETEEKWNGKESLYLQLFPLLLSQ